MKNIKTRYEYDGFPDSTDAELFIKGLRTKHQERIEKHFSDMAFEMNKADGELIIPVNPTTGVPKIPKVFGFYGELQDKINQRLKTFVF